MKKQLNILISGGGTGGHIYPAIAIANEVKERYPDANFLFVGAKDRMEMEKVPQNGYKIMGLWISGIQRKITLKNMLFPFKLISSLWKANKIISQFKPNLVIGTGGFASGPVLMRASAKKIPTLIQEQNSFPGITNKILGKKVSSICVAYEGLERFFPKEKIKITGNPVRQDLLSVVTKRDEGITHFKLNKKSKKLLVIGGSLGARAINQLIETQIHWLVEQDIQVIWQTGKLYYENYKKYSEVKGVEVHEFLNNMDLAYAAADIIISRAGAGSISELCIVGKPTVFIPSPNVTEDHQTKNAMAIVNKNAAIVIKEEELERFQIMFAGLLEDEKRQKELGDNIKKLALPNATKDIVDEALALIE